MCVGPDQFFQGLGADALALRGRFPKMRSRKLRSFAVPFVVLATLVLAPTAARAAITPSSNADDLAAAIATASATPTGASFDTMPGTGTPNGVADSALAGFPTDGATFGILTSGDVNLADDANSSPDSGANLDSTARGAFDVSVLKIDLTVLATQNCLRVDFRFLSEEYPEFVGDQFNDAFIAELDTSDWSVSGSTITATNNFAFDSNRDVVSINNSGVVSMTAANAAGTTYDGATPLLTAQTPVTEGAHSVYLSIFDAGDQVFDSAVFLDNLTLGTVTEEGACDPGVIPPEEQADLHVDKADQPDTVSAGEDIRYTVTVDNVAGPDDATNVEVVDELPAGTTFVAAAGTEWTCTFAEGVEGPDTVTCTRASIAAGTTAPPIDIDVTAPSTAGTIVDTASVSADQPDPNTANNSTTEETTVQAANTADSATTFCANGCTLDTDTGTGATPGDQTVTYLTVPDSAAPQTVSIAEIASSTPGFTTYCGGQRCNGQIVMITGGGADGVITGQGNEPIIVRLVYDKSVKGGTQIYFQKGAAAPKLVPNCTTPGVASPSPCVSTKIILSPSGDKEITVLMQFGDPSFGKR
jgi:uncharacterized repeat protein (TIGR01451 family)